MWAGTFPARVPLIIRVMAASQCLRWLRARSNRPWGYRLPTSLSDDRYHDRDPSCAQSPIDVLSRSTTDDADSNNAPVRHTILAAVHPLRGCARPCYGSPCPVWLPLFRWHVGTSLFHRLARGVLLQITKAPTPLPLPLLFFQIVDSRLSPLKFRCPQPYRPVANFIHQHSKLRTLGVHFRTPFRSCLEIAARPTPLVSFSEQEVCASGQTKARASIRK